MYVLGIGCYYHDSSAALVLDGKAVAAAQEERFTRVKHDTSFPSESVRYCLASQGISIGDVDHVVFYEKPLLKFERLLYQHVQSYPRSLGVFLSSTPSWMTEKLRVIPKIRKELGFQGDVMFLEHHLSHAASFLASPFGEAAIVTIDGVGEWTTTSIGRGEGGSVELMEQIVFPHSLGLLYSTITAYLGFSVNNSEYKVMGLSAYGDMDTKTNRYLGLLRGVIDMRGDGSYCLDMGYFSYHRSNRMPSERLCGLLGGPPRRPESEITARHNDIAAAVQMLYEEAATNILLAAHASTGSENLVFCGGCALNSVFNGKILKRTPFKRVWAQPDPGDGGTSLGAALFAYNSVLGRPRSWTFEDAYLGPAFSPQQMRDFLVSKGVRYEDLGEDENVIEAASRLISEDRVLGWFQGRMEWGPRALGARSILANPCNPRAKELLNEKVKHRERFRPFAPVVCADDADEYFECDQPLPEMTDYMLMVYPVREKWRKRLPAVTHVDGTGRLQSIRRAQNPLYYDLIKAFGRRSGIPILINTSYNIRGEPIVCTPADAYKCMMGTGIDALMMGSFLIRRGDNMGDAWDSEASAGD
jgi:carbamoyltransferase